MMPAANPDADSIIFRAAMTSWSYRIDRASNFHDSHAIHNY